MTASRGAWARNAREGRAGKKQKRRGWQRSRLGIGVESRDPEKSISAEYLIKFKPTDFKPPARLESNRRHGGGRQKSCRKERKVRVEDGKKQ